MADTVSFTKTLSIITCSATRCGVTFALDDEYIADRRKDHVTWYCPNGHPRHYPAKNAEEELRDELARKERQLASERARRDQAEADARHQAAVARGTKGALARARKRAAAGVCPAPGCKRSFADVAAHVATCHPDLVAADA